MGNISARVPDELESELEMFVDAERLDKSTAIRKLLSEGLEEWRTEHALERLERGEVTFHRAAEIAGIDTWELARLAQERDITWVGEAGLEDDLADL